MGEAARNLIKLSQLRAFVAVAEWENFSEAALQLNLSQSAVSHAIASLEEELGVMLFTRGRHGAQLTPVGTRIIQSARGVLQLLEAMETEANLEKGLHGGMVRIASFRSVATHILPAVIAQFRQRFPEINVSITEYADYVGVEDALRDRIADLGFTYLPTTEDFEAWELLRDEYIVLLPPNAQRCDSTISWEDLAKYPLIMPAAHNSCHMRIWSHVRQFNHSFKVAYEVNEDSTIVSMVSQNLGAAILPRLAAEPIPPMIPVCHLPVPLERAIAVAILSQALHTPAVFAFLELIKTTLLPQLQGFNAPKTTN